MTVGNPYVFSITWEIVDKWNEDTSFNNGLLFMSVNGVQIPQKVTTTTLNTEMHHLLEKLKKPIENEELFFMEKEEAFARLYQITYPANMEQDNDYSYSITPFEFEDNDRFVFMIRNGEQVRIIASQERKYIEEAVLSINELEDMEKCLWRAYEIDRLSVEGIINAIQKRPKMFVEEESIEYIFHFLMGFGMVSNREIDRNFCCWFHKWLGTWIREHIDETYSSQAAYWTDDIKRLATDEKSEVDLFYELSQLFFEDYRKKRGYFFSS